ncbi:MAG: hypothetical protein JNK73_08720 [Bacteroidia bacterium]|nr:hypothetical protein [Bacteroidia bacterium]
MRRVLFLLPLAILTVFSFGQDRKIVLQIDTLILNGYSDFSIALTGQFFGNYPLTIDDSCYVKKINNYPNFICSLTLKNDTTNIEISLDDKGGHLSLIGAYHLLKDTIQIDKVVVFSNCYNDTTFTRIDYFAYQPDSLTTKYLKSRFKKEITKMKCKNRPLFKTFYRINNVSYLVSFQMKKEDEEVTTFHGYKPKKYSNDPNNYKGRVTYFHGKSIKFKYVNVITLKLKSGT